MPKESGGDPEGTARREYPADAPAVETAQADGDARRPPLAGPKPAAAAKRKASAAGNTPSISSFFSKMPRTGVDGGELPARKDDGDAVQL